jgi:hypothetical protein
MLDELARLLQNLCDAQDKATWAYENSSQPEPAIAERDAFKVAVIEFVKAKLSAADSENSRLKARIDELERALMTLKENYITAPSQAFDDMCLRLGILANGCQCPACQDARRLALDAQVEWIRRLEQERNAARAALAQLDKPNP